MAWRNITSKVFNSLVAFDKNEDELRKSVADRAYVDRGYPLDVI